MASSDRSDEDEDVEQQNLIPSEGGDDEEYDGRTPLDKTIDRIGMGSYQWILLSLCGFGWMADNMWIQAVAIILPRVQKHYAVPDNYIGSVSSSMFAGMMFGAIGWGTCSDLMGRITAFNATLFFTALFGILASFASSFPSLCILLFFLGSAVGGSMPTDGTLLLEHMPKSKEYLVTALSVFFSIGSVLAAVVALLVVPQNSCLPSEDCDVDIRNQGWRYLLISLAFITLSMFLARIVFFRLHESPRYLVHAGRPLEALESLQMISRFNGSHLSLEIEDVADHHPELESSRGPVAHPNENTEPRTSPTSTTFLNVTRSELNPDISVTNTDDNSRPTLLTQYSSTDSSPMGLHAHLYSAPVGDHSDPLVAVPLPPDNAEVTKTNSYVNAPRSHPRSPSRSRTSQRPYDRQDSSQPQRASSIYERKVHSLLPKWLNEPLRGWWDRVMMVLSPKWIRTTLVIWVIWICMALAFTMFNVYLPKLLETLPSAGTASGVPDTKTLKESLWDVVIFTLGGCPGAILGAYLIESPLGRRWSLAGSTFVTAVFCVVFVTVESSWAVRASTVGISLSSTSMWAVLYGWTPEIFETKVRGTACGIASALSRVGGMIAPLLGGVLLMLDRSIPVYTSAVVFAIAGIFVLMVKEDNERDKIERSIVH